MLYSLQTSFLLLQAKLNEALANQPQADQLADVTNENKELIDNYSTLESQHTELLDRLADLTKEYEVVLSQLESLTKQNEELNNKYQQVRKSMQPCGVLVIIVLFLLLHINYIGQIGL